MRRSEIELDCGYSKHKKNPLGCDVWINCTDDKLGTKVMSKGVVLNNEWWAGYKGDKMNDKQANSVKDLAAPVDKVLEEWEWDCLDEECNASGYTIKEVDGCIVKKISVPSECPTCNGIGKVKWSWTPRVGEWCVAHNTVCLITKLHPDYGLRLDKSPFREYPSECIPFLEWETIERVIKQAGYRIDICPGYECTIIGEGSKCLAKTLAKDRLTAVYRAVIALGKEKI